MFGTVVPYGGDDRTEEIDPVAFDMPFTSEERKTPKAPVASPGALKVPAPARDYELTVPKKQLTLSDLFDSAPSSASLNPPDPAAFSSSRPPAAEPPAPFPAPFHGGSAVVAMPSISVGAEGATRREPSVSKSEPPRVETVVARAEPSAPRVEAPRIEAPAARTDIARAEPSAIRADVPVARGDDAGRAEPSPTPARAEQRSEPGFPRAEPSHFSRPEGFPRPDASSSFPRPDPRGQRDSRPPQHTPVPNEEATEHKRRSVPTLESVGNASAAAAEVASRSDAAASSPSHQTPRSNPVAARGDTLAEPVVHLPSEIATSRPPDVDLSPGPALSPSSPAPGSPALGSPSQRPDAWSPREVRQPMATVTAPVTSQAGKAQTGLPSIMLADDVEAEPDASARRALRAARATVRLELPPNFARPGSATSGAPPSGNAPAAIHAPPVVGVGHAIEPQRSWLDNPRAKRLLGAVLAGALLVVIVVLSLGPRSGSLVVTALAPGNRAVDDVTIFIDGKPLCDVSPCRIKGLTPGEHTLRASAPNLASQTEETVEISAGDEATYNIDLLAVAPEVRAGGLRVPAGDESLTLYVDGKRVGRLPQEVSGLSGGKHWIKLDPEDGSAAIEKSVNVTPGEMVEVEPKAAKRDKALVTIRLSPGSEGASVTLDDAFLLDFPAELELEPNTVHTLSATKAGYEDLTLEVKVAAGETEKLIDVALTPADGNAPAKKARPKVVRKAPAKPATTATTQLADSSQGLLNISSVPPSQIILNGRPLGSTPKTGITVPGDSLQTIVFVHPKMGRRRAQKFVPAGKERTVAIRF